MVDRALEEVGKQDPNNQLDGVGLTSLNPPPELGRDMKISDILPFAGRAYLETVADNSASHEAIGTAEDTAVKILTTLADKSDSQRGEKALAILDTADGKEIRLSHVDPYTLARTNGSTNASAEPKSYAAYMGVLNGRLTEGGAGSDPAFIGVAQSDYYSHLTDKDELPQIINSATKSVTDHVSSNNLPEAVSTYDHAVGAFARLHSNDPKLLSQFMQGMDKQLKQLNVMDDLQKEMGVEAK
jgi:hypothetical protein